MANPTPANIGRTLAATLVLAAALGSTAALAQSATDRFVVTFKAGAGAAARAAVAQAGGRVEVDLGRIDAVAVTLPRQAVATLSRHPSVEFIEPDPMRRALQFTGDFEINPYGIAMVQANLVSYNAGNPRTLCIVDSGYNLGHEDLQTSSVTGVNLTRSGDWNTDESSHGTHVAGTVAALFNGKGVVGVIPTGLLNLYIVKVFDASGSARSSVIMKAAQACADAGAHVISMSLGGGAPTRVEQRQYDTIAASNVLVVAAAGNDGTSAVSYPAGYPSVMSVAAVDSSGTWAPFSQFNADVEIAGPGVGVKSTVPLGSQLGASITVAGSPFSVQPMDGSPRLSATGALADFGIGDTARRGTMTGKVCLIQRGTISFADKVTNCERSGGIGAVIYNNQAGELFGTLAGARTGIPSVGATAADGATMLSQIGQSAEISVFGTNARYADYSGTSMATPHVSAVAALVWSHYPSCSAAQVRAALNASALDLGGDGRDDRTGNGLVQALAAFNRMAVNCGS